MKLSLLATLILLSTTAVPVFASDNAAGTQTTKDVKTEAKKSDMKAAETKTADTQTASTEKGSKQTTDSTNTTLTSNKSPVSTTAPAPNYSPNVTSSSKVEAKAETSDKASKALNNVTPVAVPGKAIETTTKASSDVPKGNPQSKDNGSKTK